jgi:serine/threonine protein kinase
MGDLLVRERANDSPDSRLKLPLLPGEIVDGKYAISRLIGTGSTGFVFSAARATLGDEVAIKVLRRESLGDGQLVARFAQEAKVAARIKSEHVVCVFDVGHLPNGTPFIVMERLEGKDLRWVLAERGPLPTELAVDYVLQACEALAGAHANGITHRDIKPENLFASRQPQGEDIIKVLDFGISKMHLRRGAADDKAALVQTTMAMGSPMYMSPEQIRAARDVDGRADIWAVGCVLYELLTGNPAFSAASLTELCAMILESKPLAPGSLGFAVAPELEAVIGRCLEKDRSRRFQTIGELATALSPFAPSHSLISVERCRDAQRDVQDVAIVADERDAQDVTITDERGDAATLKCFVPPRPPFDWKRAALAGLAVALGGGCCALLFAPHSDLPSAVATLESKAELDTPPGPSHNASPLSAPPAQSDSAAMARVQRAPQAPTKSVPPRSKVQKAASRAKEELDVGF